MYCCAANAFRTCSEELLQVIFLIAKFLFSLKIQILFFVYFQHWVCVLEHYFAWEVTFSFCVGNKIKLV